MIRLLAGIQPGRRAGVVMVLVVGSIGLAMIAAIVFLAGSTPAISIAQAATSQSQARQLSESAVSMILTQIADNPGWTAQLVDGPWTGTLAMHGGSVDLVITPAAAAAQQPEISNPSFEQQVGSLATPLLNPPMSGTIGGWGLRRTALAGTGLTVPRIGVRASANATDGGRQAFITFVAALLGTGTFRQSLSEELQPSRAYALSVDIGSTNLLTLNDGVWIEVHAGTTLVASSRECAWIVDLNDLTGLLAEAMNALNEAALPAYLTRVLLDNSIYRYTLRFESGQTPPGGELRIELHAESLGLLSEVTFDNLTLSVIGNPVRITAEAVFGGASHTTSAVAAINALGVCRVLEWNEP